MDGKESFFDAYETSIAGLKSDDASTILQSFTQLNVLKSNQASRKWFLSQGYASTVEYILCKLNPKWPNLPKIEEKMLDELFLDKPHPIGWLSLTKHFRQCDPSYKLEKLVYLLESFFLKCKFSMMFAEIDDVDDVTKEQFIASISSFPDVAANKLQLNNRETFFPENMHRNLSDAIFSALIAKRNLLADGRSTSTVFISDLIGKVVMTSGPVLVGNLVASLEQLSETDFIWRRITQRMIENVPDRCIEAILMSLLENVSWFGYMEYFLADLVTTSKKVQYLLTKKLLLFKEFCKEDILLNIVGYLGNSQSRREIFIKAFLFILDVWGDSSSIKHISFNQHLSITKTLLIFLAFIRHFSVDISLSKKAIMKSMMHGVQSHLESPQHRLLNLGTFTAKQVALIVDPSGPKLEFRIQNTPEIDSLLLLLEVPQKPDQDETLSIDAKVSNVTLNDEEEVKVLEHTNIDENTSDLDSDDDLVPFEMPQKTRKQRAARPVYIRDCMLGLIETDKPEWTQKCLESMEELIRANPDNIHEMAAELAKILLHLDDVFNIENFEMLRKNSMVAITVVSSTNAAKYLASQFYERNYNIRQRLDILETLAAGAQELSSAPRSIGRPLKQISRQATSSSDWRKVIEDRVAKKTRIISKGRTSIEASENKFTGVAGFFFFPLLNEVDRKSPSLDLFGDDAFVLGRLMYTLGVIINSAAHSVICHEMVTPILELVWTLRYHTESYVRQSLIFAFSMVLLSVPSFVLMSNHHVELLESRQWLTDTIEQDSDEQCRELSKQTLSLLVSSFKKEFDASQ